MQPKKKEKQVIRLQQSKKKETEILEGVNGFRSALSKYSAFLRKSGEKVRTNM